MSSASATILKLKLKIKKPKKTKRKRSRIRVACLSLLAACCAVTSSAKKIGVGRKLQFFEQTTANICQRRYVDVFDILISSSNFSKIEDLQLYILYI